MAELSRLQRNQERRKARERQSGKRGAGDAMSPDAGSPGSPMVQSQGKQATTRKCANCGQAGHIRLFPIFNLSSHTGLTIYLGTNKKLCPKLNGQWEALGMSPPAAPGTPNA